jgi:hypothetical protein
MVRTRERFCGLTLEWPAGGRFAWMCWADRRGGCARACSRLPDFLWAGSSPRSAWCVCQLSQRLACRSIHRWVSHGQSPRSGRRRTSHLWASAGWLLRDRTTPGVSRRRRDRSLLGRLCCRGRTDFRICRASMARVVATTSRPGRGRPGRGISERRTLVLPTRTALLRDSGAMDRDRRSSRPVLRTRPPRRFALARRHPAPRSRR